MNKLADCNDLPLPFCGPGRVQSYSNPLSSIRVRRRIFPWDRRTLVIIAEPQNARRTGRPSSFLLEQNSINSWVLYAPILKVAAPMNISVKLSQHRCTRVVQQHIQLRQGKARVSTCDNKLIVHCKGTQIDNYCHANICCRSISAASSSLPMGATAASASKVTYSPSHSLSVMS